MAQGKSPFELRADLLKLALAILTQKHYAAAISDDPDARAASTAPSSEEIIEEATKLNDFISRSGEGRRDK